MATASGLGVRRGAMPGAPPASRPFPRASGASVAVPRRAISFRATEASRCPPRALIARPGRAVAHTAAAASAAAAKTPKPAQHASLLGGLAIPLTLFAAAAGMGGPLNGALLLGVYGAHLAAATQAHSALLRQLGLRARPLATLLASLLALRLYWHWAMSVLPPQHVVGVTVKHQLHMPTALHRLLASPSAAAWTQAHHGLPGLLALALATGAALLAAEALGRAMGAVLRLLALRRAPSVPGTQLLQPEQPPAAAAAAEAAPLTPETRQALREWAPIEADCSPVTRLRSAGHADSDEEAEQPPPDACEAAGGERVSLSAADVQELRCISEGGSVAGASLRKWLEQRARDPAFARAAGQAQAMQAAQAQPPGSPYWTAAESEALRARAARTGDSVVLAWLAQQRGGGGDAAELAAALEGGSDWDSEEEQEAVPAAAEPAEPEEPRSSLTAEQAQAELQRLQLAAADEGDWALADWLRAHGSERVAAVRAWERGELLSAWDRLGVEQQRRALACCAIDQAEDALAEAQAWAARDQAAAAAAEAEAAAAAAAAKPAAEAKAGEARAAAAVAEARLACKAAELDAAFAKLAAAEARLAAARAHAEAADAGADAAAAPPERKAAAQAAAAEAAAEAAAAAAAVAEPEAAAEAADKVALAKAAALHAAGRAARAAAKAAQLAANGSAEASQQAQEEQAPGTQPQAAGQPSAEPQSERLTLEQAEAELQRSCGAAASEGAAKAEAAVTLQTSEQGEAALPAAPGSAEAPQPATAEQPLEPQPLAATAVDELQTGGLEAETDAKPAAEDAGEVPQPAHQEQEQASEAGDAFEVPIQLLPPPAQQPAAAAPKPQPAAKAAEPQEGASADASEAVRQLTPAAAREDGFAVPIQTAPGSFVLPVTEAPDAGEGHTAPLEAAGEEQPASKQQPAKAEPAGKQAAAAAVFELPITEVPDTDALQALRQRCEAAKQAAQRAAERADAAEQQTNLGRKQRRALRRTRQEAWDAHSQLRAQLLQAEAEAAEAGDKAQQQP